MDEYVAFIDESGDPQFGKGASKSFLIAAVVIPRGEQDKILESIRKVRREFGLAQFKSSNETNVERRFKICSEISKLGIKIVIVWVKKEALRGDWFKYRRGFYKFIQRIANHELYRLYNRTSVHMDRYGGVAYQESLEKYLESGLQKKLFEPQILIESAKENELIQISDYIAGSMRKYFEEEFPPEKNFLKLFQPTIVNLKIIPDEGCHLKPILDEESSIEVTACLEEARRYLESEAGKADNPKTRTIEYLYYSAIDGSNEWVYSQEIIGWLADLDFIIGEEQFRNEVVAALRDEGLVIVGSRKGIKIPLNRDDIKQYLQFNINMTLPLLKRLKKAIVFLEERAEFKNVRTLLSDDMARILEVVN